MVESAVSGPGTCVKELLEESCSGDCVFLP